MIVNLVSVHPQIPAGIQTQAHTHTLTLSQQEIQTSAYMRIASNLATNRTFL